MLNRIGFGSKASLTQLLRHLQLDLKKTFWKKFCKYLKSPKNFQLIILKNGSRSEPSEY